MPSRLWLTFVLTAFGLLTLIALGFTFIAGGPP